jgi:HD-GYP domain-containing protein (c-di-GMP phosphodiesterase class II)
MGDVLDAMIACRPYNNVLTIDDAIAEFEKESGKQFNPELVETFCEFVEKNREMIELLLLKSGGGKPKKKLDRSRRNLGEPEPCAN